MTASTGNVPGRIFMSYRREEISYPAGWLFDRLASHFSRDMVFKDVDSIDLGDDFVEVITTAVGSCDVLLALIGDRWLTMTDQDGQRRLDDPHDFVRLEIEAALTRNVRVIPILVEGARMPRADELPASLAKLVRWQALELSPSRFDSDIRGLLRVLDRTISEAQEQARQQAEEAAAQRRRQVEQLQQKIRARDWDAVLAASGELAAVDPAAADPDSLASAAREQLTRRQQAEEAAVEARQRADDAPTVLGELVRETASAQGLTPADHAGAEPVVGPAASSSGVDHHMTSQAGDDHLPLVADIPGRGPGEKRTPATGLRLAGHTIPPRLVIIATAIGIGIIGLVTAITACSSTNGTNGSISVRTTLSPTPGSVSGPLSSRRWAYTTGNAVFSSPAVAGGTVYIGSWDLNVYALDAATGHVRWAYSTGGEVSSSPAVAGGTVYVGSADHKVYALGAAEGDVRWTYTTGDEVNSSPAVAGGTVYVGSADHKVYALDAATGQVRWAYSTGGAVYSSPAVAGGTVYIGSADHKVYALDAATGHVRWTYTTGGPVSSNLFTLSGPAVAGGTVYIGSDDHKVYALDAATGHVRWTYTTGFSVESRPAVVGGTVYIGSFDDKVYALDAATGHVRWTYTTGGFVQSSPAVAGGTVYIGSFDDKVYALDAAAGHVRWTYTTGDEADSSPAVAGGTVYIGSNDDTVYALKAAGS
jgi:outer membrane protein assembly factor BamB